MLICRGRILPRDIVRPLNLKLRVPPGYFEFFMPESQQTKKTVAALVGIRTLITMRSVNSDYLMGSERNSGNFLGISWWLHIP